MKNLRKRSEGFNISFLDVMACGLGAVILVLMLVKYQSELPDTQSSALQVDIATLELQNQQLQEAIEKLQKQVGKTQAELAQMDAQFLSLVQQINTKKDAQRSLKSQIAKLQTQADTPPQAPSAPVPVVNKSLEDYLLGLKVEGRKIVILVDSSASMTEERLIDIIRYKVASEKERQQAPKWQRTLGIVEWLVARVPQGSEYKVIYFAEQAEFAGDDDWKQGADPKDAAAVLASFSEIAPEGGTNLQAGVALMQKSAAGFSNVYLITDGTPTQGKLGRVRAAFSGCPSSTSKAQKISGKCRQRLLDAVIQSYRKNAPVNVILLPLEGDSGAAGAFWRWTVKSAGLLISPDTSWP